MKTSIFSQNIQKAIAIMFATTFAVSFTACTDNLMADDNQPANNTEAQSELLEPYGLTYQNFISPSDVVILNADTTEISVSKELAEKLGITTFVNHPMGIWHKIEQLPYARKAIAERLVGDRYILTVEPASLAELIGEKEMQLNTGLYVNNDIQEGAVTRAGGVDMPAYAAKYVDADQVIHPAVIHMTDPLGYDSYHDPDDQAAMTRSASDDGCYDYITPETMACTRASAHKRILSFNEEVNVNKQFACGDNDKDTINFDLNVPIDFELNYFITLNGGVKWKVCIPVPYVKKFEAGLDGKFAFSPKMTIGFTKELKLNENKFKKTLVKFPEYSFTFWVGTVPVVVKCKPNLYTKIDGKVNAQAYLGFKYEYENNFKSGVCYKSGDGWSAIKEFNEVKNDFTFIRPQAKVKAEAGIGLYLGMDVMIYDVVGPTVSVGPRLGAEAELKISPFEKSWNEKTDFSANINLSVNAEVGAKLKVLGYELAEYKTTFRLAGPWTLWKYPSDGTEHKVGDWDFAPEDYTNFDILMNGLLKTAYAKDYKAWKNDAIKQLMEIYDIDFAAADKLVQKSVMTQMIHQYGRILTEPTIYGVVVNYVANYGAEVNTKYDEYLMQKAAEEGDMTYVNAKNWENIMDMLKTNEDVRKALNKYTCAEQSVHQWFKEDFKREPNESPEDLEWLTDHIINVEKYGLERANKKDDNEEVYVYGWVDVKAKLVSLYSDIFEAYPEQSEKAYEIAKDWYEDYWLGYEPTTIPYYFDGFKEEFVAALKKNGIKTEFRE